MQVVENWYPGSDKDSKGVLLVVTAGKEGAISGGDKFISVSSAERQHRQLSTCSAVDRLADGLVCRSACQQQLLAAAHGAFDSVPSYTEHL